MSYSREELKDFITERQRQSKVVAIEQSRAKMAAAKTARELVTDPRWVHYVDEVEKMRAQKQVASEACNSQLINTGILDPVAYGNLKLDQIRNQTFAAALQWALDTVQWAIADGEKAEEQMKVVDNKT